MIPGGWRLMIGDRVAAIGRLDAVISAGVERRLILEERYPAARTGDEVVRHRLVPGARVEPAAWRRAQRRYAA